VDLNDNKLRAQIIAVLLVCVGVVLVAGVMVRWFR
jgi:hypothetical protein